MSDMELRFHPAMPGWCKLVGLDIRAVPECAQVPGADVKQEIEMSDEIDIDAAKVLFLRLDGDVTHMDDEEILEKIRSGKISVSGSTDEEMVRNFHKLVSNADQKLN